MRVAITGHTSGFGAIMTKVFTDLGHDVTGISRTTDFDLSDPETRLFFSKVAHHNMYDVVVLNCRVNQVEMIEQLQHSEWPIEGRSLVVMGSRAPDAGLVSHAPLYASDKARLDFYMRHAAVDLSKRCKVRTLYVRPTYISGTGHDDQTCVDGVDLATTISDMLVIPRYSTVRELTMYPIHK